MTDTAVPRSLKDCDYSAFISYAHADDEAWFSWVTHFRNELERGLKAVLRGVPLPPLHLSGDNGPISGLLEEQLDARIARSFATIIVVHDNYAASEWCLKELEYFKARFGMQGLREWLYVVAMSEEAMLSVAQGSAWQRLLAGVNLVWMPFFDTRKRGQPMPVYIGKELVNPDFTEPFLELRTDLAAKLRKASAQPSQAAAAAAAAATAATAFVPAAPAGAAVAAAASAAPVPPAPGVRIYIESNRVERELWESLGEQIRDQWDALDASNGGTSAPLRLRTRGLPIDQIDEHPPLDDADGVVLLWGAKTADALIAQINKVENKMPPGRDAAPGIVAYLMPPQQASEPVPAWGWRVLRFQAADRDAVQVLAEERDDLADFLRRVRERHERLGGATGVTP